MTPLLVELVRLGEVGDRRRVVAELLAEARAQQQQRRAAGALDGRERLADRALRGIELAGGGERGGVIGDELGDVRRALARLAQDLGRLERLTEEAGVDGRGLAQALDGGRRRPCARRRLRHQLGELGPQLVVAVPLLEAIVDRLVVGRRAVRELERALHALGVARGLPHRRELAGELGRALGRLDGEQALHQHARPRAGCRASPSCATTRRRISRSSGATISAAR